MRLFLWSWFILQTLILLLQFGSSLSHKTLEWIPYFISIPKRVVKPVRNQTASDVVKGETVLGSGAGIADGASSVTRFEALRANQLSQFAIAQSLQPLNIDSGKASENSSQGSKAPVLSFQTNPRQILDSLIQTLFYFHQEYRLVWFSVPFDLPVFVRIFLICGFLLPLLHYLLYRRPRGKEPFLLFLWYLKERKFKEAYCLWQKPGVLDRLLQEKQGLQTKWFEYLIRLEKTDEALRWGSVILTRHKNSSFADRFCEFLMEFHPPFPLNFSEVMTRYLRRTKKTDVAKKIWNQSMKGQTEWLRDSQARELASCIFDLTGNEEIRTALQA